jgi:hypothetical protein
MQWEWQRCQLIDSAWEQILSSQLLKNLLQFFDKHCKDVSIDNLV